MHNTLTIPTVRSEKTRFKSILLYCGIFSSLLYIAMNVFIPMGFEGYSSRSHTVSELSAIGAPTRTLWVWLGHVYTLLAAAFGWGVWQSAGANRPLRITGILLIAYGIIGVAWAFTPMHQRAVLAAGGESLTDTLHLAMAGISVVFMTAAIGFSAAAFGKKFRRYAIATILVLLVFGLLTAAEAPKVQANLPTPLAGVWERINIGVFLIWIIVLAVVLLRSGKDIAFTSLKQ